MPPGEPQTLAVYANQLDELETVSRTPIIDLNGVDHLSDLRDKHKNASDTPSEHQLSTTADTDDIAYLESVEHGQYSAGFEVQAGVGARLPSTPTGDSVVRWGYYNEDGTVAGGDDQEGEPENGFYFGADSEGIFVAKVDAGSKDKVYQEDWNRDVLDGKGGAGNGPNPSGRTLDVSNGCVYQIEFVYYGYGAIKMQVLMNDDDNDQFGASELVTVHVFHNNSATTIEDTNLPLRTEISSGGTSNDALDLFVGGRQFSIVGKETTNARRTGHYRNELTGVDDTKWHAAITFRAKDGTDIGSKDFTHVLSEVGGFEVDTDNNAYRWQVRRGTVPDNPTWENPTSAEDHQDETALKVDTSSADVQDGNGDLTGVAIDGGTLASGGNNEADIKDVNANGALPSGTNVTLLFKATPGATGTLSEIYFKMEENW